MDNLKLKELEVRLVDLLNSSDLPIEAKRLIVSEVYTNISSTANGYISQLVKEKQEEENKETSETVEE